MTVNSISSIGRQVSFRAEDKQQKTEQLVKKVKNKADEFVGDDSKTIKRVRLEAGLGLILGLIFRGKNKKGESQNRLVSGIKKMVVVVGLAELARAILKKPKSTNKTEKTAEKPINETAKVSAEQVKETAPIAIEDKLEAKEKEPTKAEK